MFFVFGLVSAIVALIFGVASVIGLATHSIELFLMYLGYCICLAISACAYFKLDSMDKKIKKLSGEEDIQESDIDPFR